MFNDLKIAHMNINELHPYPENPRTWTKTQLEHLKEGIKRNGWLVPIVVNRATSSFNTILGGHMRVEAARELGYLEVPAVCVTVDDKKKESEIVLRLNQNTGDWDMEKLRELFDVEFLVDVGFDDTQLADVFDDVLQVDDDDFQLERAVDEIKVPRTKPGEMYDLAGHRVICGDATDPAVIKRLVGEQRIEMLYSDPPFNLGISYDKGISGKMRYGGQTNDSKTDEEYRSFLRISLANGLAVCKNNCHVFTYCDQRYIGMLQNLYGELGIENKRVALYIKNNFNMTPHIAFNKCYEPCIYGVKGKPYLSPRAQNFTEILNKEISNGNRTIDDILDMLDIWLCRRLPTTEYSHPTAKNPSLHERPIRRCTKVGDAILDLFGGSGSTLIAANQLKRKAFIVEWEPIFVDVILQRFEKTFGIKPSLITP
ncbi:MAG: DNA methyltransferase [Candidatus Peribacteraceae bacterium]|nr:DNA methyltransferase [Candidatus Peribacteraceae bacterium]